MQYIRIISKRKKKTIKLTPEEEQRLDELELILPYDTLVLYVVGPPISFLKFDLCTLEYDAQCVCWRWTCVLSESV